MDLILSPDIPEVYDFLTTPIRYKVMYGGRGAGKSFAVADTLLVMGTQKPLRILCARELQISIADSVHRLLSDRIEALDLDAFYRITQKSIEGINGTAFLFKGLKHNYREIKSTEGIDICWVEEAENVAARSWEVLAPTIRKENSEIWVTFNTKNVTDATYSRFVVKTPKNAVVKKVSWRDNHFFPEVLDIERIDMQQRDPEAYAHIWEGEPDTRYSGAIYAKEMAALHARGHLSVKVAHDNAYPVYTLWDLGFGDTCVIWFYQVGNGEILMIDYYENNGEGIGHYCDVLKGKESGYERFGKYNYEGHYVPQDAKKKLMEANGKSIVEQAWNDHGVRMVVINETTHANRHAALRALLPKLWFHPERCAPGIDALMAYHFTYSEDMQRFSKDPYHDWSSHACFTGDTNILTEHGVRSMLNLPHRGKVLTLCGWKEYVNPRITKKNASLVEVAFKDGYTVKCTPEHLFLTEKGWRYAKYLTPCIVIQSTLTRSHNISMAHYIVYGREKNIYPKEDRAFIEMCGEKLLEISQRVATLITKIIPQLIINYPIWSVYQPVNTYQRHGKKQSIVENLSVLVISVIKKGLNGINQKMGNCGINNITRNKKSVGYGSQLKKIASNAEKNLKQQKEKMGMKENFVPMKCADSLIIESVKKLKEKQDVWCLTVPDTAHFSLANGAVVHNCTALELLPSSHGKSITIKQIEHKRKVSDFFKRRRENRMEKQDPYRVKPLRKS